MIEIVFGESACGSLKVAQHYGVGKYHGSAVGVILDSESPAQDEIRAAQHKAEEHARHAWENAVPLGGSPADVYCIGLMLSIGEISENEIGAQRRRVFEDMYSVWPMENTEQKIEKDLQAAQETLTAVCSRCAAGEAIRIWYSNKPEELCGLHFLMSKLYQLKCSGPIYTVKLPDWECPNDNTLIQRNGWGEMAPGEWGRYLHLQEKASPAFIAGCAARWHQLQEENAPLRVMLSGQLVSTAEDIYDSFILREIMRHDGQFMEARVIADVLGRYPLGLGDAWISIRIDKMISDGILKIVTQAPADGPIYRRWLIRSEL